MNPTQLIDLVITTLQRPDFQLLAEGKLYQAIKSAHQIELFRRDLMSEWFLDAVQHPAWTGSTYTKDSNGVCLLNLPVRFRKLYAIHTFAVAEEKDINTFKDLGNSTELVNYFGFRYQKTFNIFRNRLNIAGVSDGIDRIRVDSVIYPAYWFDTGLQEWQTDSWIMAEYPDIIEAYLKLSLSKITQTQDLIASAREDVALARRTLLQTYVSDILARPSWE